MSENDKDLNEIKEDQSVSENVEESAEVIEEKTEATEPAEETEETEENSEETVEEVKEAENEAEEIGEVIFEADEANKVEKIVFKRKPYHERYYMLYGGEEVPEIIDVKGTLDYLKELGFGDNGLTQARKDKDVAEKLETQNLAESITGRCCDFCGAPLNGVEYDVLKDGRQRCTVCSRSVVKSEKQFVELFKDVRQNMETFFGIRIREGIDINMVNAKTLHKKIGQNFVPGPEGTGRVLGFATMDKDGKFTLYIENGSPRLASISTMAHELTHIWQYQNWNAEEIAAKYGGDGQTLVVYEGMAMWTQIQYLLLIGETDMGKREDLIASLRTDEYGIGYKKFTEEYPLSFSPCLEGDTPFDDPQKPL